jgi:hypothetical protein
MNEITVDIDVPYHDFLKSAQFAVIRERLDAVPFIKSRQIRRSCNGNVHLKIGLERSLTLFDSLLLRAYLDDDPARLACDMARYYRSRKMEDTGRCFFVKYVNGTARLAGKWERF